MGSSMSPVERAEAELEMVNRLMAGEPEEETTDQETEEAVVKSDEISQEAGEPSKSEEQEKSEQKDEIDYEQKWKSFEGMYSKAMRQIDELKAQNQELNSQVEALASHAQDDNQPSGNVIKDGASKADIAEHLKALSSEYGDDFAEALGSVMKGIAGQEVSGLMSEVDKLNSRIDSVSKISETEKRNNFKRDLTSKVTDWEEIFTSNDFAMWLDSNSESLSGRSYQDLFAEANNSWDLNRMVRFFESYKKETGRAPNEEKAKPKEDPRANQVAPKRGSSSANTPQTAPEEIVWNVAKVNAFYEALRRGEFEGREEEAQRLEASIFAKQKAS